MRVFTGGGGTWNKGNLFVALMFLRLLLVANRRWAQHFLQRGAIRLGPAASSGPVTFAVCLSHCHCDTSDRRSFNQRTETAAADVEEEAAGHMGQIL